jgi:adenylate cyclase
MKIELEEQVKKMLTGAFEIEEINEVPRLEDSRLILGCKGVGFEATVIYIVLNDSQSLIERYNEVTLAKIRLIYYHVISEIVTPLGGQVRQAHDDGVYVFFQGQTQKMLNIAVKAALKIKYMLTNEVSKIRKILEEYQAINFAMGIDEGAILGVKLGNETTYAHEVVWSGKALHTAIHIAQHLDTFSPVGISERVYYQLTEAVKYKKGQDKAGNLRLNDIWHLASFEKNNTVQNYYCTSSYWTVN